MSTSTRSGSNPSSRPLPSAAARSHGDRRRARRWRGRSRGRACRARTPRRRRSRGSCRRLNGRAAGPCRLRAAVVARPQRAFCLVGLDSLEGRGERRLDVSLPHPWSRSGSASGCSSERSSPVISSTGVTITRGDRFDVGAAVTVLGRLGSAPPRLTDSRKRSICRPTSL